MQVWSVIIQVDYMWSRDRQCVNVSCFKNSNLVSSKQYYVILQFKGFKIHSPPKKEDFSLEDLSRILIDQFSHGTIVSKLSEYGLLFLIFHVSMINCPKLTRVCIFNTQNIQGVPSLWTQLQQRFSNFYDDISKKDQVCNKTQN